MKITGSPVRTQWEGYYRNPGKRGQWARRGGQDSEGFLLLYVYIHLFILRHDLMEPKLASSQLFSQGWLCILDPFNFTSQVLELQAYTTDPNFWHLFLS